MCTMQLSSLMVAVLVEPFNEKKWTSVLDFGDMVVSTPDNFNDLEDDDHIGDDFTTRYSESGDVLIG